MHKVTKILAGSLLAAAALGTAAPATASVPRDGVAAKAAPCYSPDGIYAANGGATISGTLYWSNHRAGSYWFTMSNTRNQKTATVFVQFLKHVDGGLSYWTDRVQATQADGRSGPYSASFAKPYQVDKVGFTVGDQGQTIGYLAWDNNSACGA